MFGALVSLIQPFYIARIFRRAYFLFFPSQNVLHRKKLLINFHSFRLPWDQTTITGWMFEMAYHTDLFYFYFFVSFSLLTLFISIFEYHRSFYELFKHLIGKLDMNEQLYKPIQIYQLKVCLRDTIILHTSAKK